ncbi:hypothetical protein WJX73_004700 [Symbiochloris irregularis]|uniref:Glutamyl-tRNA(Gln) amidotransferase subunit B, chloroplastic/mitochondrial n=1 Tax=Symbiochloris irregularis TaxID=706552 RepID=A0AAW1PMU0_9CHLO
MLLVGRGALPFPCCLLISLRDLGLQRHITYCRAAIHPLSGRAARRAPAGRNTTTAAAVAAPEQSKHQTKQNKGGQQAAKTAWEAIVGIECHIQLNTRTKAFCSCSNQFGGQPNAHVCPVCLAHPGALPVLNQETVHKGMLASLALNCSIAHTSKFDRKQYFYPDLPKGYQISQYDIPLGSSGSLELMFKDGTKRQVSIERAHLEEDAGKLVHGGSDQLSGSTHSLVDYNRAGVPLLEVVSGPDLRSGREAAAYAAELHRIMSLVGVIDVHAQDAVMRCDVNVSVRKKGEEQLRTRVEVKNMNSLSAIQKAVEYEMERQVELIESGRESEIVQETRLFDEDKGHTFSMRKKEGLADYRYFPEPDLPLLQIEENIISEVKDSLPEMPSAARQRLLQLKLPIADVLTLTDDMETATYLSAVLAAGAPPKQAANWVMGDLLGYCKEHKAHIGDLDLTPQLLAEMITLIESGTISGKIGKQILPDLIKGKVSPGSLEKWVKTEGLAQISDEATIAAMIDEVLASKPQELEQYRGGKTKLQGFFVGLVMKESQGRVNPAIMNKILMQRLQATKS